MQRVLRFATPATGPRLADHTTLRLGGPASEFATAQTEADLIAALAAADAAKRPVLVLGGGSNLVVADEGFDGLVIHVGHRSLRFRSAGDHVIVDIAAGEVWDDVVACCLAEGLAGLECLSGIPGLAGATPIQNVGAYGAEIADVVVGVRAFDRVERAHVVLDKVTCGFGYRTSVLKGNPRYAVLGLEISLMQSKNSAPVRYSELAAALGVSLGETAPAGEVRNAVLELRSKKGMLIDPDDPDSVSAGSFFTNPVLPQAGVPKDAPRWPVGDGMVKTSAAWLIEHAGFGRGYAYGRVGVSGKHTLALVNRGGASTSELLELARKIRDGVYDTFGVTLEVEPALVGVEL